MANFSDMSNEAPNAGGDITAVVAWRPSSKVHARQVDVGGEVSEALRAIADSADQVVASGDGTVYDPDNIQDDDVPFLVVQPDDLLDPTLLEEIRKGASLDSATPDELLQKPIKCHAILIGDDPETRSVYLRRYSPVQVARKTLITRLVAGTLDRIDDPILAFDDQIDVVFRPDGIFVLHQKNFEALFGDTDVVLARIPEWVTDLAAQVPIQAASVELLAIRAAASSVVRRKLSAINRRGHLMGVTVSDVREVLKLLEFDDGDFLDGDEIVLTSANERVLMNMLNEDLYRGAFSKIRLAATYKSEA